MSSDKGKTATFNNYRSPRGNCCLLPVDEPDFDDETKHCQNEAMLFSQTPAADLGIVEAPQFLTHPKIQGIDNLNESEQLAEKTDHLMLYDDIVVDLDFHSTKR